MAARFLGPVFAVVTWRRKATNRTMPDVRQIVIRDALGATLLDFLREVKAIAAIEWLCVAVQHTRGSSIECVGVWEWTRPDAIKRARAAAE